MRRLLPALVVLAAVLLPARAMAEKVNVTGVAAACEDFLRLAPGDLTSMRETFCEYYRKTGGNGLIARDYLDYIETFVSVIQTVRNLREILVLYQAGEYADPAKADAALFQIARNHKELLDVIAHKAALSVKEFELAKDFPLGVSSYEAYRRTQLAAQAVEELYERARENAGQ